MKCPNCGNDVAEGQLYCPACGHRLESQTNDEQGAGEAAAPPVRPNICPVCGSTLPEDSVFCPHCGTRLFGEDDASADETVSVPDANAHAGTRRRNADSTQAMPVLLNDADDEVTRPTAQTPEPDATQVAPRVSAPSPSRTATTRPAPAPRRATAAPSPARTSTRSAGTSKGSHRGARVAIVTVCCAVIVISLAVIVSVAAGVGPFGTSATDTSTQQVATTEATTSDADSSDTSDADASSATDSSSTDNSTTTASDSSTTADSSTNDGTTGSSSDADSSSSTSDDSTSTSGTVTLSSDGTVSSTAGYTLTVPTSYSIQSSDASGDVVLTDPQGSCTISVTIDPNTNGIDTETAYEQATRGVSDAAYTTTARDMSWYVVSDDTGSSSYYVMSYVEPNRIVTLRFDYPSSSQSTSGPIIESVQPTFKVS